MHVRVPMCLSFVCFPLHYFRVKQSALLPGDFFLSKPHYIRANPKLQVRSRPLIGLANGMDTPGSTSHTITHCSIAREADVGFPNSSSMTSWATPTEVLKARKACCSTLANSSTCEPYVSRSRAAAAFGRKISVKLSRGLDASPRVEGSTRS